MEQTKMTRNEISTALGFSPGSFSTEATSYDYEAGRLQILWGALKTQLWTSICRNVPASRVESPDREKP